MDLVLFGIQGSGKGTQAKKLAREFGFDYFEAGGELRKIAATESELGHTVKSYVDEGKLVPFAIIMQVVEEAIRARSSTQKILFDGIPRDTDQMDSFDRIMAEAGRDFRCIELAVDELSALERIRGRARLEGRKDDSDEEKILRRMETFKSKTVPVIERYRSLGNVAAVDGNGTVEEVYERLKSVVENWNNKK
jgi:adenylate kinase